MISFATVAQSVADPLVRAAEQIRTHQTRDGAIVMGTLPARESRIIPYFASFAALGLVAAYRKTHNVHYLSAAKQWADWYAAHLNLDGTVYDYTGAPGAWQPTGDYDSTDSYAATYLELLLAIQEASPDDAWLRRHADAVRQAVAAVRLTLQPVGLTLAKPAWPVMYTMDNTETARGLHAASALAHRLGLSELAKETTAMAARMEEAITHDLWDPQRNAYRIGIQPDGGKMEGLEKWYPDLMANLMAIAWLPASERNKTLFARLKTEFGAELPKGVQTGHDLDRLVWWGWAAHGAGDATLLAEICTRLSNCDVTVPSFDDPAHLGHICRLLYEIRK